MAWPNVSQRLQKNKTARSLVGDDTGLYFDRWGFRWCWCPCSDPLMTPGSSHMACSLRPPIIVRDISLPAPMAVKESKYAASISKKPMKSMLTGPITLPQMVISMWGCCWNLVVDTHGSPVLMHEPVPCDCVFKVTQPLDGITHILKMDTMTLRLA
jgi:hypothetical protein